MKQLICFVGTMLALAGCDSTGRVGNTKALNAEIKASQIKRVTNTQLIYTADEWGKKISQISEKALANQVAKNPDQAAAVCKDLSKIAVIAALEKEYGVRVELLGLADITNPQFEKKEREILDAYLYSAKSKSAASDNLQLLNDSLLLYNAPVAAENPVCKACMPDQEIPFAVWRLLFNKKDIIRKLDAKQLK